MYIPVEYANMSGEERVAQCAKNIAYWQALDAASRFAAPDDMVDADGRFLEDAFEKLFTGTPDPKTYANVAINILSIIGNSNVRPSAKRAIVLSKIGAKAASLYRSSLEANEEKNPLQNIIKSVELAAETAISRWWQSHNGQELSVIVRLYVQMTVFRIANASM